METILVLSEQETTLVSGGDPESEASLTAFLERMRREFNDYIPPVTACSSLLQILRTWGTNMNEKIACPWYTSSKWASEDRVASDSELSQVAGGIIQGPMSDLEPKPGGNRSWWDEITALL